jgi:hypothetical protein
VDEQPVYDRDQARRALHQIRTNRRSESPETLAAACEALGYRIDRQRGKGSHWCAIRRGAPTITLPTGRDSVSARLATSILRVLEEVFDSDGN